MPLRVSADRVPMPVLPFLLLSMPAALHLPSGYIGSTVFHLPALVAAEKIFEQPLALPLIHWATFELNRSIFHSQFFSPGNPLTIVAVAG